MFGSAEWFAYSALTTEVTRRSDIGAWLSLLLVLLD